MTPIRWRYSSKRVGVFGANALCLLPLILVLVRWKWTSFYVAVAGVALFAAIEMAGYTVTVLARRLRCKIVGRRRDGTPPEKRSFYA